MVSLRAQSDRLWRYSEEGLGFQARSHLAVGKKRKLRKSSQSGARGAARPQQPSPLTRGETRERKALHTSPQTRRPQREGLQADKGSPSPSEYWDGGRVGGGVPLQQLLRWTPEPGRRQNYGDQKSPRRGLLTDKSVQPG